MIDQIHIKQLAVSLEDTSFTDSIAGAEDVTDDAVEDDEEEILRGICNRKEEESRLGVISINALALRRF